MNKNLRRGRIIAVYMLLLIFGNGCSTPEERGKLPGDTSKTVSPSISASKVLVEIKDMKFHPDVITVHKGDTVVWINHDMVTHCVTEENSKAWTSSNIAAGNSWNMVVQSGADYFCAIHQVMKGKIIVE